MRMRNQGEERRMHKKEEVEGKNKREREEYEGMKRRREKRLATVDVFVSFF